VVCGFYKEGEKMEDKQMSISDIFKVLSGVVEALLRSNKHIGAEIFLLEKKNQRKANTYKQG